MTQDAMDFNGKLVGQIVEVLPRRWVGTVIKVKDSETFVVKDGKGILHDVDIFNIRSLVL